MTQPESRQIQPEGRGQLDWIGNNRAVEFGPIVLIDAPRARRTDPATSHAAAAHVKKSGALNRQQTEILALVREHPGSTAIELAKHARPDDWRAYRFSVSRRLPELATGGYVRRGRPRVCRVAGTAQTTWHPVKSAEHEAAA